ncbi:MAG: MotA/TolQ/ExbB proton channel family protein, partial [Xanthomonadales bacterium]|nr:MotA/TolQ/ExbB proton channel family protein [Xanthomonadales bacterium]
ANTAVSEPEVKTVASEVNKGGLVGYVIVTLGLIGLVLIVLRALFLANAGSSINKISAAAEPLLRQRRIDDAIAATKRFKGSAARVVTSALRNLERDRDHLEDIVSEAILHENTRLNRFGAIILMIAGVAPLLGLLGTVTGMIQTFAVITEFGTSDPKLLAGGIATALVTTELGLIVAIPCLLGGNLLGGWAERLKDDMEKAALSVINQYKDQPTLARAA